MTHDRETGYRDDDDELPLRRPARYRWVVWLMVAMLFVGPAFTLISVLKIAPMLVVTVAAFGVAAIYFVRGSRNPPPGGKE